MAKTSRTFLEFDASSRELFAQLAKSLAGPSGETLKNKDVFFIAMAWGHQHGVKAKSIKKSGTGVRIEYLKDEDRALIAAIHLAECGNLDELLEEDKGFELAELFAEGGIRLLAEEMKNPGQFGEAFAAEIATQAREVAVEED